MNFINYDDVFMVCHVVTASAEFVESDVKINTTSGRVVLKKHYASQPNQFHSFRF